MSLSIGEIEKDMHIGIVQTKEGITDRSFVGGIFKVKAVCLPFVAIEYLSEVRKSLYGTNTINFNDYLIVEISEEFVEALDQGELCKATTSAAE